MRLLALVFFHGLLYGLPGVWGYFGGGPLIPIIGAAITALSMVRDGWRAGGRGEAGKIKSLTIGTIFSAIPCLAAWALGHWLTGASTALHGAG